MFGSLSDVAQHLDVQFFGVIDRHEIFLCGLPIGPRSAMSDFLLILDQRADNGLRLFHCASCMDFPSHSSNRSGSRLRLRRREDRREIAALHALN